MADPGRGSSGSGGAALAAPPAPHAAAAPAAGAYAASLADIQAAAERIKGHAKVTPVRLRGGGATQGRQEMAGSCKENRGRCHCREVILVTDLLYSTRREPPCTPPSGHDLLID